MFLSNSFVNRFLSCLLVLVVSLGPVSAVGIADSQSGFKDGLSVSGSVFDADADAIIQKVKDSKSIDLTRSYVTYEELSVGDIVQIDNSNGYIRYLVYWGLDPQDSTKILLLSNNDKFSEHVSLETFKKE